MPVRRQEEQMPVTSQAAVKINAQAIVTLILAALVFSNLQVDPIGSGSGSS